ncbi:ribosomal-protein-alanine N-acetyltransferase [compost metagenome]
MEAEQAAGMQTDDGIRFRPMTTLDIPDVMVIEHESFTLPWTENAFHSEMTQNHFAKYIIMEKDGAPIGYAGMWTVVDEAHVTNIAVRTAYRGQHLGERLMREMMLLAGRIGMTKMTLEARVSNTVAQSLYGKLGFRPVGLRKGYYSDNQEDALIMWCDLPDDIVARYGEGSEWDL